MVSPEVLRNVLRSEMLSEHGQKKSSKLWAALEIDIVLLVRGIRKPPLSQYKGMSFFMHLR